MSEDELKIELIDKDKAINALIPIMCEHSIEIDVQNEIVLCLLNSPTVEAKPVEWIPVTELDLDHNQEALIKLDDGFICSAKFLISDSGNNCGFYHKHIGFLQCPQVVAWMPYNAERGGKNE